MYFHCIFKSASIRSGTCTLQTLAALRQGYSRRLSETVIPIDTRFRDAARMGKPLSYVADHNRGVQAYTELLDSLLKRRPLPAEVEAI